VNDNRRKGWSNVLEPFLMVEIFAMVACFTFANQDGHHCIFVNPGDIFRSVDDCKAALQNDSRYRRDRLAPNIELACRNKPDWTWTEPG
jgi:hypothetical protein